MSITEIREEVLRLSEADRADLVGALIDTLDGADPNDSGQDSLTEARIRGEELAMGKVQGVSKDEFLEEFRNSRSK